MALKKFILSLEEAMGKKTFLDSVYKLEWVCRKAKSDKQKMLLLLGMMYDSVANGVLSSGELSTGNLSGRGKPNCKGSAP